LLAKTHTIFHMIFRPKSEIAAHPRSKLQGIHSKIELHWNDLINYAETKMSNGVLEGINSMVQSAKSSTRGFRTRNNIILITYFRFGKCSSIYPLDLMRNQTERYID